MLAMRKVSVVGTSGSGKTTLAAALAPKLGVPHVELDSIYHQPDWTPLPEEEYRQRVAEIAAGPGWVIDGNYSAVRDLVWAEADTVVVLAYPRQLVMRRIVSRSLRRVVTGEVMWNGNRERWRNLLSWKPEQNINLWAFTTYQKNIDRYLAAMTDPRWKHLRFHRFTSPAEARRWLGVVARSGGGS